MGGEVDLMVLIGGVDEQVLQEYMSPYLKLHANSSSDLSFIQSGAPAHFANLVHSFLNKNFAGRVIGRRDSIEWLPQFRDLSLLDTF